LIKPKMRFCDHGAYYENRYFVRWQKPKEIIDFRLPILENCAVAFGDAILKTSDGVSIGVEDGVDIVCNPSASFHVLGSLDHRINNLVMESTAKAGGICLYSNFRGCDGERVFYDGGSAIAQNGQLYARIPQFDIEDVVCFLQLFGF
uniref:NADH:flavin oxidoreductase n=1 Tax=Gongylonema pulchrum TaxID=637853 RepID=A0A183EMN4_9BILA